MFTDPRTWASCRVDGFRCSLITGRDVAGDSRLTLFVRSSLYGPLSPRPRARLGRLSCDAVSTQLDEVSFLESSGVKSEDLRMTAYQNRNATAISANVSAKTWPTVTGDYSLISATAICASSGLSGSRGTIIASGTCARSVPKDTVRSPCVTP